MNIRIYFENMQDKFKVTYSLKSLIRKAVKATLKYEKVQNNTEVSVTFTDDESIKILNYQYRSIDRATDVLSFPLEDDIDELSPNELLMLGDIVISLERARAQADEFGHSFERETAFLCVHSMLHLLGYDHETGEEDELDMRRRQREIMESIGLGVKTE